MVFLLVVNFYVYLQIRYGEVVGIIGFFGIGKFIILKIIVGFFVLDKVNISNLIFYVFVRILLFVNYKFDRCNIQGEVYVRGKKRDGLISDEEILIFGFRIGLVIVFYC